MDGRVRLRARKGSRDPYRFPSGDDALGRALFADLLRAQAEGAQPPAMVVVWEREVALFGLAPALAEPQPHRERLISALAGQPEVQAAAMLGVVNLRFGRGDPGSPCAVVYLEFPDNRWWTAWQPVDEHRQPRGDGPTVRRAVDGHPRPGGVGGWFAMCRRLGLRLTLTPVVAREGWVN